MFILAHQISLMPILSSLIGLTQHMHQSLALAFSVLMGLITTPMMYTAIEYEAKLPQQAD